MLGTTVVILLALWLPKLVSSHQLGGFNHVLPVIGLVAFLIQTISGRRTVV